MRASDGSRPPPLAAGIAHGIGGAVGLGVLLFALRGPARGVRVGVGSFGTTSAALFAAALLSGIAMLWLRRKAVAISIHGGFAITAYVLLLAWVSLG